MSAVDDERLAQIRDNVALAVEEFGAVTQHEASAGEAP